MNKHAEKLKAECIRAAKKKNSMPDLFGFENKPENESGWPAALEIDRLEAELTKCRESKDSMHKRLVKFEDGLMKVRVWLQQMPMGGVGELGATQEELDAAANAGRHCEGDCCYHIAQQCYLFAKDALKP